jgi:hypothetical protein
MMSEAFQKFCRIFETFYCFRIKLVRLQSGLFWKCYFKAVQDRFCTLQDSFRAVLETL